jgi:alpha-tubulin suppressor-like RCC1 family protein
MLSLLGWGLNNDGQLGLGNDEQHRTPQPVEFFDGRRLKNIVGGDLHTIFLVSDGQVYGAGQNRYGNIGLPSTTLQYFTPEPIPTLTNVENVFSGQSYGYALTESGTVYSWGSGLNYVLLNTSEDD